MGRPSGGLNPHVTGYQDRGRVSMLEFRRHSPVKILLINYEYPPVGGGAANATQCLGRVFLRLGHEIHVLTSGLRGKAGTTDEDGLRIHRLPIERAHADRASLPEMISFIWRSRGGAVRLQRENGFDGTVAFFTIPCGPAALRLLRRDKVPYVISLRGGDVPGHVPGLDRMHRLTRSWRRTVLRNAAAVVANSEGLAATSRSADPVPVRIIPTGVDCEAFHPAPDCELRPGTEPLRLLFIGRLHPEKNLSLVLRQIAALPDGTRNRVELQVAGDGAERPELESLASDLGLASHVRWLGWQAKEAVPDLYRSADVLINPAHYEGLSNVVLEAMASGLPVIASDVPGNRAVVVPGHTGVLFPLDRPGQLGEALMRIEADRAWGRSLGRAGRRRVETEFSWLGAAQSYLELLRPVRPALRPS